MIRRHFFILMLAVALLGMACNQPQKQREEKEQKQKIEHEYVKVSGSAFGTVYNITYESKGGKLLKNEIDSVLSVFDNSLSTYKKNSLISRINKGEKVKTDRFFTTVFDKAMTLSRETSGAFDVTIAPVVNAWGFGFTNKSDINPKLITGLLEYVGYDKVKHIDGYVKKDNPNVMFDFNAIAKGFGVDVVGDYLKELGIKNFLVEIGGEIVARGKNASGKNWSVGIDKPVDNAHPGEELQAIVRFSDRALATSGNYRRFYVRDGVKYAHTIDPKSGYPVQHSLLSATVVADDCITADGYATAFMVMGLEKTKNFLKKHPELDVFLVFSDSQGRYQTWQTEGMRTILQEI